MRYPTYCSALSPTMTRRPGREAMSKSARGGVVWGMRPALIPFAAIRAKSRSTVARSWYSFPAASGVNDRYVTPRTYSFASPTKRNLPRTQGRGVERGGDVGTRAGDTTAAVPPADTSGMTCLRSGLSLVEPSAWLGTMRRMSNPRACSVRATIQAGCVPASGMPYAGRAKRTARTAQRKDGKRCNDWAKDVLLNYNSPAAALAARSNVLLA